MVFRRVFVTIAIGTSALSYAGFLAAVPATADSADVALPGISYAKAIVGDTSHGHVFVGGQGGLDMAPVGGGAATALPGAPADVTALALANDGSTLWVGAADGSVASYSSSDPAAGPLRTFAAAGGITCVGAMAAAGDGRVWAIGGECASSAELAVLDPVSGSWTTGVATQLFGRRLTTPATVAIDSGDGTTLAVSENGAAAAKALIATVDVSGTVATTISSTSEQVGAYRLAVTPDGAHVIVARGQGSAVSYAANNLSDVSGASYFNSYPVASTQDAEAVAVSADGTHVATSGVGGTTTFGPYPASTRWVRSCGTGLLDQLAWVGDVVFGATATGAAVALHRCDSATVAQSLLFLAATRSTYVVRGAKFTALLPLYYHGMPVANERVAITRSDRSGTHPVPTVMTNADGYATMADRPQRTGTVRYTFRFAGDGDVPAASGHYDFQVYTVPTSIGMSLPRAVDLDAPTLIHLHLKPGEGGRSVAGKVLRVYRTDASGRHGVGAVTTDRDGRAHIVDHPHVGGSVGYQAVFAGDLTFAGSSSTPGSTLVFHRRARVTVRADHGVVAYGAETTLHIHISSGTNRRLKVLAVTRLHGKSRRTVVADTIADPHGDLLIRRHVTRRTVFRVEFAGDLRNLRAAAQVVQQVRGRITLRFSGSQRTVNGLHVFPRGSSIPMSATVAPYGGRTCIMAERAYIQNGEWNYLGYTPCHEARPDGSFSYTYRVTSDIPAGVRFAFRLVTYANSTSASTHSNWICARWA